MTFTDDDLKRLKARLELVTDTWGLDRLVARLEAAERINSRLITWPEDLQSRHLGLLMIQDLEAWRKAAGK